jgi:hypothetical protein
MGGFNMPLFAILAAPCFALTRLLTATSVTAQAEYDKHGPGPTLTECAPGDFNFRGIQMRLAIAVVSLFIFAGPGHAESTWSIFHGDHGDFLLLSADGNVREFYLDTNFQGIIGSAGRKGPLVFKLIADGKHYKGTAYVPSCGQAGYDVEGEVHALPDEGEDHKSYIELSGEMPNLDAHGRECRATSKVLKLEFLTCQRGLGKCSNCNCGGATMPELRPVFHEVGDPNYGEKPHAISGARCPYLYAWNDGESRWESYGKMIHGAENPGHEMTEVVALSSFATKFRLAEEESETSFIDALRLKVYLRNGSEVTLEPQMTEGDTPPGQIRIAPFTEAKFNFTLPPAIKEADVEKASLFITGYYEVVPPPAVAAHH